LHHFLNQFVLAAGQFDVFAIRPFGVVTTMVVQPTDINDHIG